MPDAMPAIVDVVVAAVLEMAEIPNRDEILRRIREVVNVNHDPPNKSLPVSDVGIEGVYPLEEAAADARARAALNAREKAAAARGEPPRVTTLQDVRRWYEEQWQHPLWASEVESATDALTEAQIARAIEGLREAAMRAAGRAVEDAILYGGGVVGIMTPPSPDHWTDDPA